MTCLEVYLNNVHVCTAGVGDFGVLSAMLTWVHRRSDERPAGLPDEQWIAEELTFDVVGSRADDDEVRQKCEWLSRDLTIGDRVEIRIVDAESYDQPELKDLAEWDQ